MKVNSLERLVQIAVILRKATEDADDVFHNTTVCRIYYVDQNFFIATNYGKHSFRNNRVY